MHPGASTGIGRHAAETLAKEGFTVFAGVRSPKAFEELAAIDPEHLLPIALDVTQQGQIDTALPKILAELYRRGVPLVGLVNNAGVGKERMVDMRSERILPSFLPSFTYLR